MRVNKELVQQLVEPVLALEGGKLIIAADKLTVDQNNRYGPPVEFLHRFKFFVRIIIKNNLFVINTLAIKQVFCSCAVGTVTGSINLNLIHYISSQK